MKRVFGILLAMMLIAAYLPATLAEPADDGSSVYFDDFEEYTEYNPDDASTYAVVNTDTALPGGNWSVSKAWVNQWWNTERVYFKTVADHGKVLALGRGGDGSVTAANWIAPHADLSSSYMVSFDFLVEPLEGDNATINRFYFSVSPNADSYYVLQGREKWGGGFIISKKVEGGAEQVLYNSDTWGWAKEAWVTAQIIVNQGTISFQMSNADDGTPIESGSVVDPDPLMCSGDDIGIALGNSTAKTTYIDNFQVKSYDPYIDGGVEPATVMYCNRAVDAPFENGVFDLQQPAVVRKIISEVPYAVSVSDDGQAFTPLVDSDAFENGNWLNTISSTPARYIKLEGLTNPTEVAVLTEADITEENRLLFGTTYQYVARICDTEEDITWSCDVPGIIEVTDGLVRPLHRGTCTIIAANNGQEIRLPLRVLGEMELAEENGQIESYLADKKPVIDAINTAIAGQDVAAMEQVLTGEGNTALSYILDFDQTLLEGLSVDELKQLSERMLSYPAFQEEDGSLSVRVILDLLQTVELEIYVAQFNNASAFDIAEAITTHGEAMGIDTEDLYYLQYMDGVHEWLSNKTYSSLADLQEAFQEGCLMAAYQGILSSGSYEQLLIHFQSFIGYDTEHYDAIRDKSAFYDALISQKKSIANREDMRAFIDAYEESSGGNNSNRPSGGGSGGGGRRPSSSGGGSTGTIVIPKEDAAEAIKPPKTVSQQFSDVDSQHWAFADISALSALQIMTGYADGTFAPEQSITRAEFCKIAAKAFGLTVAEDIAPFADIAPNDWFYEPMLAAKSSGILRGDGTDCRPNDVMTRAELAAFLYRIAGQQQITLTIVRDQPPVFADQDAIPEWAVTSVIRLFAGGVLSGMSDGTFQPTGQVTRAEAARAVNQLRLLLYNKSES